MDASLGGPPAEYRGRLCEQSPLLSIGPGNASRIYRTTDAGATWDLQFANPDPKAFFDAMAFWDGDRGVAFSDSIDGRSPPTTTPCVASRNATEKIPEEAPRAPFGWGAGERAAIARLRW